MYSAGLGKFVPWNLQKNTRSIGTDAKCVWLTTLLLTAEMANIDRSQADA